MKRKICALIILAANAVGFGAAAQCTEFKINNEQYKRILDMMQEQGIMTPYKMGCKAEKIDLYVCTIRGEEVVILTYAPKESDNINTITFVATAKSLDRVSYLAAMASLSLNGKIASLPDQSKGIAMLKSEKASIERTMMNIILRGGEPSMELTPGGERFYYEINTGQAAVRVVPRDWK